MKRQLADRARQAEALEKQQRELLQSHGNDRESGAGAGGNSIDDAVTNAKEFQMNMKSRTIQVPSSADPIRSATSTTGSSGNSGGGNGNRTAPTTPKIDKPGNRNTNLEGTTTSVSSSNTSTSTLSAVMESRTSVKRDTPSSLPDAVVNRNHSSSPSFAKDDELHQQRPMKVPRLHGHEERIISPVNADVDHNSSSKTTTTSDRSSKDTSSSNTDVATTTASSSQPLLKQSSSRRLSLPVDPQLPNPSNFMDTAGGNNNNNFDDSSSSQQSAFYLKHQNRALATELKSYQYSIAELQQERTLRRSHCYRIFQTVQQLGHVWNTIESSIASTTNDQKESNDNDGATNTNDDIGNNLTNNMNIASTGTDDSIEWTRALQNALLTLGRCTIPLERRTASRRVNNSNDAMVQSPSHMTTYDNVDQVDLQSVDDLVTNLSSRAKILQDWLQSIIQRQQQNSDVRGSCDPNDNTVSIIGMQQQQVSDLLARCATLEGQVTELVACRTDLIQRERRLRRNIYRMSAELLTPEQVVSSSMMRPDDVSSDYDTAANGDDIETAVQIEKQELLVLKKEHQSLMDTINATRESAGTSDNTKDHIENHHTSHLLSKQVDEYHEKVTLLEESISIAERSMHDLNILLNEKENEITVLSQRQLSDDDRIKLESIPSTMLLLRHTQQRNEELQSKLKTTEQMWSQTLANEKAAVHSVSDLIQKFNKRWSELTASSFTAHPKADAATTVDTNDTPDATMNETILSSWDGSTLPLTTTEMPNEHPQIAMSKQIKELQHKLHQALENVRQSESSRENLKTAISLNTPLQNKLDELKAKYNAISARSSANNHVSSAVTHGTTLPKNKKVADIISSNSSNSMKNGVSSTVDDAIVPDSIPNGNDNGAGTVSQTELVPLATLHEDKKSTTLRKEKIESGTTTTSSSAPSRPSATSSSSDKYRKVQKKIAAMNINHSTMMTTNTRLLKQITEKDEMNAKSLSTILHLKSTTEKLIEERDHLEVQMKNASQLALAARLATNAKDRVTEEILKEKNDLEQQRMVLEEQLQTTEIELQRISIELANASSTIATKDGELSNMIQRSSRLVEENEHHREEIRRLNNSVSRAEREAREASELLSAVTTKTNKDGTGDSGNESNVRSSSSFTVEQLQTQVSVLKNRLACPVCHYRDKECIIIRCRHMHCKQCVDERVSNRSRKCPTCNVKFAENEVETIFLS